MSKNFYRDFDSSFGNRFNHFITSLIVPFFCGILGTSLVLGIVFGIPNIKNKLFSLGETYTEGTVLTSTSSASGTLNAVSLTNYSDTAIFASNKVLPSIVGITVNYTVTPNSPFFVSQSATAEGSGIIISQDGYILTNNHIINSEDSSNYYEVSKATSVNVYLYNDNTTYTATIIGTDEETDLAVIKIDKTGLTSAELGDSSSVKIGEFVLAIGNPLGMQSSVTSGIVSAIDRQVTDDNGNTFTLIQTDAAINAGNSGGALVNSEGKIIGINTLKLSGTGIEGMGFAIPINDTIDIYTQLITSGKVSRPYIGITGVQLDEITSNYYNLPVRYICKIY